MRFFRRKAALSWSHRMVSGQHWVSLQGNAFLDEDLAGLWAELERVVEPLVLDVGDSRWSSIGIRSLRDAAMRAQAKGPLIGMARVPSLLLSTLISVPHMEQLFAIKSVQLEMICPTCSREHAIDLENNQQLTAEVSRRRPCEACGAALEIDGSPSDYAALVELTASSITLASDPSEWSGGAANRAEPHRVGEMLGAQYRVIRMLDSGGMSTVYEAVHSAMDRRVAAKVVAQPSTVQQEWFRNEARLIARLRHPNIVGVYDFGVSGDLLYLIMEYLEGENLRVHLCRGPIRPVSRALLIFRDCVSAVAAAHLEGIVHRDLKPENLMLQVTPQGEVLKVLDFGLAVSGERGAEASSGGTPQYMSPEQWQKKKTSAKTDQYALGLILYEMLTGSPVFYSDSIKDYMRQHLRADVPALADIAGTKESIRLASDVVRRMAAKNPEDRYPDLHAVLQEVDSILFSLGGDVIALRSEVATGEAAPVWLLGRATEPALARSILGDVLTAAGAIKTPSSAKMGAIGDAVGIVSVPASDWKNHWMPWCDAPGRAPKTLVLFGDDAELASRAPLGELPQALAGRLDPRLVAALVAAMANPSTTSIGQYLSHGGHYVPLTALHHKEASLKILDESLQAAGVRSMIRRKVALICDELILNAFAQGRPDRLSRFARAASEPVVAAPVTRVGWLRWAVDGDSVVISLQDFYGTLLRDDVYRSLFERRRPVEEQTSGMGMGLGLVFRHSSAVLFQVLADAMTEVTAVIPARSHTVAEGDRTLGWLWRDSQPQLATGDLGKGLSMRVNVQGGRRFVRLYGHVSEASRLNPLFSFEGELTVDLGGVKGINSNGVRLWIDAHRNRSPSLRLDIRSCPPEFIDVLAMIGPTFLRPAEISSIVLPYFCPPCGREQKVLAAVEDLAEALHTGETPQRCCEVCGKALEFDRVPEPFFGSLR